MVDIYISWCKGLPDSKQALEIIKGSPLVAGVETLNKEEGCMEKLQAAGLKVSLHNPTHALNLDLSDDYFVDVLEKNPNITDSIRKSDAPVIGFHVYYKAGYLYGFKGYKFDQEIYDKTVRKKDVLVKNVINNLVSIEKLINVGVEENDKKIVLFENGAYYYYKSLGRDKPFSEEENVLVRMTDYATSLEFIKTIIGDKTIKENKNIGFLFDIAHLFSSAVTRAIKNEIEISAEEYIDRIIDATKGKVFQLHLNVAKGDESVGMVDDHRVFVPGNEISEKFLKIAKKLIDANPCLKAVTLEIEPWVKPVEHAKILVAQAELIGERLGLK